MSRALTPEQKAAEKARNRAWYLRNREHKNAVQNARRRREKHASMIMRALATRPWRVDEAPHAHG
jgi:hypothetical protein